MRGRGFFLAAGFLFAVLVGGAFLGFVVFVFGFGLVFVFGLDLVAMAVSYRRSWPDTWRSCAGSTWAA